MMKKGNNSGRLAVACITIAIFFVFGTVCWKADAENCKNEKPTPPAVNTSIQKAFPGAQITKVESETQTVTIYEVDMTVNGKKRTLEISSDGEILSVEKIISSQELPPVVAEAITKKVGNGKLKKLEHREVRAVFAVKAMDKPETLYEAEYKKDGKSMESVFNNDGKQIED